MSRKSSGCDYEYDVQTPNPRGPYTVRTPAVEGPSTQINQSFRRSIKRVNSR
ncbi:hypothetical protein BaRGS_00001813, partial [Batillaria attramentaria]